MVIDMNATIGGDSVSAFIRHDYKLGFVVEYLLQDEPHCGDSWILLPAENLWNRWLRGALYVLALGFLFVGISIVSDIFVSSIEMITSKKRVVKFYDSEAQVMEKREVLIWNETVANLTLMALGSSAPEIMLSTLETCMNLGKEQTKDGLGVFTIIGSAAFNLLVIIAVCISAVGEQPKRIGQLGVFILTSLWSMFAYIWLLLVLDYITPGQVDWWEAALTLAFFPLLVLSAYYTDLLSARKRKKKKHASEYLDRRRSSAVTGVKVGSLTRKKKSMKNVLKDMSSASQGNQATTSFVKKKSEESDGFTIQEQLKNQAIVNWQQKHSLVDLMKVFNDRFKKDGVADDRMSQLVQLLALTQETKEGKRFDASMKPKVLFLSPQMITQPGETVARVEVIITHIPSNTQQQDNIQSKDDMFLLESVVPSEGRVCEPASCTMLSSPALQRIKGPRLSVTALDSAYGSTSSVAGVVGKRAPLAECETAKRIAEVEATIDDELTVQFETRDASAKAGIHYKSTTGQLKFCEEKRIQVIEVPLMDNYLSSAIEREIFVILHSPSNKVELGKASVTRVTIMPNVGAEVGFAKDVSYLPSNEAREITITVQRCDALETTVSVEYSTELDSAQGGLDLDTCDFVPTAGLLVFERLETSKDIVLQCKAAWRKCFYVVLKNALKCKISPHFGMTHIKLCTEEEDDESAAENLDAIGSDCNSRVLKVVGRASSTRDQLLDGNPWTLQIKEAFQFGLEDEDGETPSVIGYVGHFLSFMWKVLFSLLIPPACYKSGLFTFWLSLLAIAVLVLIVEELGNLLGCVIGLENAITGITIIALGTSLPDTFASRTAALHEQHADASIGNVTGSNSVNVFLGLGVPWVVSAIYNMATTGGAHIVHTNNLSFSVTAFLIVGVVCLAIIIARRFVVGGELGGSRPVRWGSSLLLLGLWVGYTTVCSMKALNYF